MELPVENVLAAYPPTERAGGATLPPLTVGGAIRMLSLGIDLGRDVTAAEAATAAAALAGAEPAGFARAFKGDPKALQGAVNRQVALAFRTFVAGPRSPRTGGNGWLLEIAEFLAHEYGWAWRECLDTPLATAFALLVCARSRNGGDNGAPDYVERQKIERMMRHG